MESSRKQPYQAPSSEAVNIRTSGVLCDSPNDYNTQMNVRYTEETI